MHRRLIAILIVFLVVVSSDAQVPGPQKQTAPASASTISPPIPPLDNSVPSQYCVGCHNQRAKTAGLMLDSMDYANIGKDAETWEKVIRKIKTGMMPPSRRAASRARGARCVRVGNRKASRCGGRARIRIPELRRCIG